MILLLFNVSVNAQNCQGYDQKCELTDNSYTIGSASQGLKIQYGEKVTVVCMTYEGSENFISVCGEAEVGAIQFKILTADTKEELYENSDDNYNQSIDLRVDVTAKIIIQLSIPNAKNSFTESKCIGLLLAHKKLSW